MTPRDDQPQREPASAEDDAAPEQLRALIDGWKRSAPPPPSDLEARIRAAVQAQLALSPVPPRPAVAAGDASAAPVRRIPRRGTAVLKSAGRVLRHSPARWGAAAAVLVLAAGALALTGVLPGGRKHETRHILVADALRAAEQAEREHAAAIAQLEVAARPILARADDRELPPAQVALLLSYRDRLRAVDSAIAEIQGILEHNAGHAGARTYLLAAYMDKTRLLRDLLALQLPTQPGQEGKS